MRKGVMYAPPLALAALLVLSPATILLGCGAIMNSFDMAGQSEPARAAYDLLDRASKSLAEQYPMAACGTTVAMPRDDIRLLGLAFHIRGPLTKAQLRAILVDCAQIFLVLVNEDERVRPSLNHYPFGVRDIEIGLFIDEAAYGDGVADPHIGTASIRKDKLVYWVFEMRNGIPKLKDEQIESYAEALEELKQEQGGAA